MTRSLSLLALSSLLVACASSIEPLTSCDASGAATPLCGYQNPEDLVRLPGGQSLLVSEFAGMEPGGSGAISRLDLATATHTPIYVSGDGGTLTPGWGDANCPGAPETISPHGIDLVRRNDGGLALAVVNHAGRESVEMFEVLDATGAATVTWRGCTVAPENAWFNDVVGLPDGGFLVSHMMPRSSGASYLFQVIKTGVFGAATGHVLEWSQETGFQHVPGTDTSFANGIAISPDGSTLFVNSSIGNEVRRIDRASGRVTGSAEVRGPDNSAWSEDGRLFVASLTAPLGEIQACAELETGACPASFAIVAVDPETLATETIYESDGATMGAGTVGLQVGDELFIGTFAGDRILRVALSQANQ